MVANVQGQMATVLIKEYEAALDKLILAENKIDGSSGSQNAADQAYRAVVAIRKKAKTQGIKLKDIPASLSKQRLTGDGTTPRTKVDSLKTMMDDASITYDGSSYKVAVASPNESDPTGDKVPLQKYLYYQPKGTDVGIKIPFKDPQKLSESNVEFGNLDTVRDLYQKQLLKLYGSNQGLINKLFESGYLKTNKIPANKISQSILGALGQAVEEYTVQQVDDYKTKGVKEFQSLDAFLSGGKRDTKSLTQTTKRQTVYDDTRATALANALSQQLKGRDANAKELKDLIPLIQDFQKKNPEITTSTDNQDGTFSSVVTKTSGDPEEFLLDKLSQQDETKARSVLGYYDAFKSVIGVQ